MAVAVAIGVTHFIFSHDDIKVALFINCRCRPRTFSFPSGLAKAKLCLLFQVFYCSYCLNTGQEYSSQSFDNDRTLTLESFKRTDRK